MSLVAPVYFYIQLSPHVSMEGKKKLTQGRSSVDSFFLPYLNSPFLAERGPPNI